MTILFLIGRILYGGYFIISGWGHFAKHEMLTGYAKSKGVPSAGALVYLSGLFIILGGLGILLGVYIPYAVALLVIFLLLVSLKMHAYWQVTDPMQRMGEMVNFRKNIALLGAALMLLAITGPWAYSLF